MSLTSRSVISIMLDWGLMLRLAARDCRGLLHELRQSMDALIDTVVLRLTRDMEQNIINAPASAKAIAIFHNRCPVARQLHVHFSYSASTDKLAASGFVVLYVAEHARADSPSKQCLIRVHHGCSMHLVPLVSLLPALPSLEAVTL